MGRSLVTVGVLLTAGGLALSCGESSATGGSATGGSGGTPPTLELGGAAESSEPSTCGFAQFYCETERCIGVEECEGVGSARITRCRCVAQLPALGGAGGASSGADDGGVGGELPAAPDPYPGAGCPVDPSDVAVACSDPCNRETPCVYAGFSLCCGPRVGEDCGRSWEHCE